MTAVDFENSLAGHYTRVLLGFFFVWGFFGFVFFFISMVWNSIV